MASEYGEPWYQPETPRGIGGAIVSATYQRNLHICPREPCMDLDCWRAYGGWLLFESATPAIAERIMLCINAMAGVSNETLREHMKRGGYAEAVPIG